MSIHNSPIHPQFTQLVPIDEHLYNAFPLPKKIKRPFEKSEIKQYVCLVKPRLLLARITHTIDTNGKPGALQSGRRGFTEPSQ